jgi:hypothetical protein
MISVSMREEPTQRILPKPISEMTDEEVRQQFPRDMKRLESLGAVVTDHGVTITLSAAAAEEFLAAIAEPDPTEQP